MVIDVTEADFDTEVVQRSRDLPVVVDFWAAWCAPCRALGPILEAEATRREGSVVLAKIDTDANPTLAQAMQVQGIPAVKAFRDGAVVGEFTGVKPAAEVAAFFDSLLPPPPPPELDLTDEESLRGALTADPLRAEAALALARLLYARGDLDEALRVLEGVPGSFAAQGLAARLRLQKAGEDGPVTSAFEALDAGETRRGLELLEAAVRAGGERREDLRQIMVGVFDELGADDALAREFRRRLATALY